MHLRRWFDPLIIDWSVYTDDELRSTAIPVVPCSPAQSDLPDAFDNGVGNVSGLMGTDPKESSNALCQNVAGMKYK